MYLYALRSSVAFRTALLTSLYTIGLVISLWLGYLIRFDFLIPSEEYVGFYMACVWGIPLKLLLLFCLRQTQVLLGYFSIPGLMRIFLAVTMGSVALWIVRLATGHTLYAPPRGVILADCFLSLIAIVSVRLALRIAYERYRSMRPADETPTRRVGIVGAGDAGVALAHELIAKNRLLLQPVAFFDDDETKWGSRVYSIPVVGRPETMFKKVVEKYQIAEIIIAMPSATVKRIREVVKLCQENHLKCETVPSLGQLATGQVKISQIRPVDIQDLLGRPQVQLDSEHIKTLIADKVVLVTGAGGSIGSELCRQAASYRPRKLLLLERCEIQLFIIEQELIRAGFSGIIEPLIGDLLDDARLQYVLAHYQPDIIFHAAAHKHVPLMESQPGEAIRNNSIGTARLALLAAKYGVAWFVMISTDKAINPTSVMGATKRLAEIYVQALQPLHKKSTKYMAVRFGNVLGSSGSVIPIFKQQIAEGGPVTVTHPEVKRYFMTIPEAVGLVLQCCVQGIGGEIFVLDMGKPVKIVDLATQLIELSGLKPGTDIEIQFTGLRPGEKLFEELNYADELHSPTRHPQIMRFTGSVPSLAEVDAHLHKLDNALHSLSVDDLKMLLKKAIPEYQPQLGTLPKKPLVTEGVNHVELAGTIPRSMPPLNPVPVD